MATPRSMGALGEEEKEKAQDWSIDRSIALARKGSFSAVGQLLDHFREYLLAVANEELPSDLAAKIGASDVVQETCYQATRDFRDFRGQTEPELRAWLRKILLHNLIDAQRRFQGTQARSVDREESGPGVISRLLADLLSPDPAPSAVAATHEALAALETAMATLPEDYRKVIRLRHFDAMPFEEIGVAMARSAEAARKLWARAVEQLARELSSHDSTDRTTDRRPGGPGA